MPPLGLHMAIARQVQDALKADDLCDEQGGYLLGSTAPDIRVLTRWDRQLTHFFDIFNFDDQHGVEGLFDAHPQVAKASLLNAESRAFMAGYLTHLEADEAWINLVYRPYFGVGSDLEGDNRANVLDRVLQYELERRVREDQGFMESCATALSKAALDIEVGFLERETLERWREVNLDVVARPPDWDRFRHIASRHLRDAGIETMEAIDAFMTTIPDLLTETHTHVTQQKVDEFMDLARERSLASVREYLQ
ncbi:MAG: zinc dependent phospholipase C family protein [Dehalococcoidia bacterium]